MTELYKKIPIRILTSVAAITAITVAVFIYRSHSKTNKYDLLKKSLSTNIQKEKVGQQAAKAKTRKNDSKPKSSQSSTIESEKEKNNNENFNANTVVINYDEQIGFPKEILDSVDNMTSEQTKQSYKILHQKTEAPASLLKITGKKEAEKTKRKAEKIEFEKNSEKANQKRNKRNANKTSESEIDYSNLSTLFNTDSESDFESEIDYSNLSTLFNTDSESDFESEIDYNDSSTPFNTESEEETRKNDSEPQSPQLSANESEEQSTSTETEIDDPLASESEMDEPIGKDNIQCTETTIPKTPEKSKNTIKSQASPFTTVDHFPSRQNSILFPSDIL